MRYLLLIPATAAIVCCALFGGFWAHYRWGCVRGAVILAFALMFQICALYMAALAAR